MEIIDLATWERRAHFRFFLGFENPYFNVCTNVDVTRLYRMSRAEEGPSFFLGSLFAAARAANETEAFRYRIRGERVVLHDVVHPGSTVLRPDETFTFAYFEYRDDFSRFAPPAAVELDAARRSEGPLDPRAEDDDQLHFSILPWISFTSFSHARRWGTTDSVPKIVFGRHFDRAGQRMMPVSVEVHHSLVDGLHVGRWLERVQEILDESSFGL